MNLDKMYEKAQARRAETRARLEALTDDQLYETAADPRDRIGDVLIAVKLLGSRGRFDYLEQLADGAHDWAAAQARRVLRGPIVMTAWALAGDWAWNERGYYVRLKGGRQLYETAAATPYGRSVCLERMELTGDWFRVVRRYVKPDQLMELIKE